MKTLATILTILASVLTGITAEALSRNEALTKHLFGEIKETAEFIYESNGQKFTIVPKAAIVSYTDNTTQISVTYEVTPEGEKMEKLGLSVTIFYREKLLIETLTYIQVQADQEVISAPEKVALGHVLLMKHQQNVQFKYERYQWDFSITNLTSVLGE